MASIAEAGGNPKVLWQPPLDHGDPDSSQWFTDVLQRAAARVRSEEFPAIESTACRSCPVRALCPAKNPAQQLGLGLGLGLAVEAAASAQLVEQAATL
jgi:hypothetical protein